MKPPKQSALEFQQKHVCGNIRNGNVRPYDNQSQLTPVLRQPLPPARRKNLRTPTRTFEVRTPRPYGYLGIRKRQGKTKERMRPIHPQTCIFSNFGKILRHCCLNCLKRPQKNQLCNFQQTLQLCKKNCSNERLNFEIPLIFHTSILNIYFLI